MATSERNRKALERFWAARRKRWAKVLAEFESSGLKAPAFCRKHSIPYSTFFLWRRRLKGSAPSASPAFVPVTIRNAASPAPSVPSPALVEVVLSSGRLLRVHADWTPETVARLISALEPAAC